MLSNVCAETLWWPKDSKTSKRETHRNLRGLVDFIHLYMHNSPNSAIGTLHFAFS